jgi:hypothetical protein
MNKFLCLVLLSGVVLGGERECVKNCELRFPSTKVADFNGARNCIQDCNNKF